MTLSREAREGLGGRCLGLGCVEVLAGEPFLVWTAPAWTFREPLLPICWPSRGFAVWESSPRGYGEPVFLSCCRFTFA